MHLTFISFDAYPLLDPTARSGIGGAEVRAMTFARNLRDLSSAKIAVVIDSRPGLAASMEGLELIGYQKPKVSPVAKLGRSILKRFTTRPAMNTFFRDLQTDALLCFGVRNDTAGIVESARASGKKSVVFLTSDRNLVDAQRRGRNDRGVYGEIGSLCRFALTHADLVVAQSPFQKQELLNKFGIEARLIRNPIDLHPMVETTPDAPASKRILWVGRADTFSKRADLCIELARRCPKLPFQMIMNSHDAHTFEKLSAQVPSNVEIVEQVPFVKVDSYFNEARLLINTSAAEGFPNSFLQAAKYGKPIVSLKVDPGEMLSLHGCGICAQDNLEHMADVVETLVANRQYYNEISKRAARYVRQYHDAVDRSAELLEALGSSQSDHAKISCIVR